MDDLASAIDQAAVDTGFSGVVRIDVGNEVMIERAYGFADRAHRAPNTSSTIFGIASATKGITAMLVMRLVEFGTLALTTPDRDVLGATVATSYSH
jgi:CubicO group peptidase (beta-lactamase class C family)